MSAKEVSGLDAHVGFWLRAVSNHVSHGFAAKLAARGATVAEWVVLRALYGQAPMPPSRLARQLGMTRGAITKLADRLIAKALAVRTASETDGRAQTLALTAKGNALVPRLAQLADQNDAEVFDSLTKDERTALLHVLRKLVEQRRISTTPVD